MEDKVSGNTAVEASESNPAPAKKASKSKAKTQQKKVSSHPPTAEMVTAAIRDLKDRKGSSFQAIKKYIASTYKVDGEKVAPFIKRYLKTAVSAGAVVQTKGKGATGSFKLSTDKPKPKSSKGKAQRASLVHSGAKKEARVEKTTTARKPAAAKKPAAKKAAPKKPAQKTAAKATAKKAKAASEPKSPSKAKKTVKAPAAKTKTPKPKKATAKTVKASAKK